MPASSTSQPSLVADMLELLEVAPGHRVLEVGAGTGYNAALLAELVGDQRLVVTVDVAEDVVAQTRRLLAGAGYPGITVLCRDGFDGVPERARSTVSWPRWAARTCPRSGQSSSPRTAGCWCRCDTLVGTRCSCSGGRMAGCAAGWRAGPGSWTRAASSTLTGCGSMGIAEPDDQGEVGERAPWPGFGAYQTDPGPDDPVDEQDFLFYLSLVDRRACWAPGGVALSDGLNGWATADRRGIRWWRDEALADDLDRHHAEWLAIGRPTLGDYRVAFVPVERGPPTPAHGLGAGPPLLPRTPLARGALKPTARGGSKHKATSVPPPMGDHRSARRAHVGEFSGAGPLWVIVQVTRLPSGLPPLAHWRAACCPMHPVRPQREGDTEHVRGPH